MVHGVEASVLLAPLEKREVHYPERCEHLRVSQAETVTHLDSQHSELGLGLALGSAEHEDEITRLRLAGPGHLMKFLRGEELVHR